MTAKTLIINTSSIKCRGCLAESGEMKNMYEWDLCDDFYKFTSIQVKRSDGITELLCSRCEENLVRCRRFRVQCLRSDVLLRNKVHVIKQPVYKSKPVADHRISPDQEEKLEENFFRHIFEGSGMTLVISTADVESRVNLPCPYKCSETFLKRRSLILHLIKFHHKNKEFNINLQYHCPYKRCSYFLDSGKNKYFTERKFLIQHFNKKHKAKIFSCEQCSQKFSKETDFFRHLRTCNQVFHCDICNLNYKSRETYSVHLLRKHPNVHEEFKLNNKMERSRKRISETIVRDAKKTKTELDRKLNRYICDSPKRSFATQTFVDDKCLKNDVSLANLDIEYKNTDEIDRNYTTNETQTVFEDLLSLKSQNSEDDSLFFPDTVSDIQTQTWSEEFGGKSKKGTAASPDLIIKETQTCICLYDSPKPNFPKSLFDSATSSPSSINLTSTETQTAEFSSYTNIKTDVMLSFSSAETQTCFDEILDKNNL